MLLVSATAAVLALTVSGTVTDQTNKPVAGVTLTLGNPSSDTKSDATMDKTGHFEFSNVAAGQYELRASRPGFMLLVETFSVDRADVTRNLNLQLGEIHQTVNVSVDPSDAASAERGAAPRPAPPTCSGPEGGQVVPPLELKHVKPRYPESQKTARASGVVELAGHISTDGRITGLKTLSAPNAEFETAARTAVQQWEFSPTYLNCTPVDIVIHVTVKFTTERK